MTLMRAFAPLAFVLVGAVLLVVILRSREHGRVIDGWQIVEWSVAIRGMSIALCAMISGATVVLLGSLYKNPSRAILLTAISAVSICYALFFWRNRLKYKDGTIVVSSTWGSARTMRLVDLQFTGSIGPRGHEYSTADGSTIFINSYQDGAKELIDFIAKSGSPV